MKTFHQTTRSMLYMVKHPNCDITMHYKHMFISTDCLLLARIVRPLLGGDAVLCSVGIRMSVGSLQSANVIAH